MYREVTMIELREALRLWQEHLPKKQIAARLGLDPKILAVLEPKPSRELSALAGRVLRLNPAASAVGDASAATDRRSSSRRGLDPLPGTAGENPGLAEFRATTHEDP